MFKIVTILAILGFSTPLFAQETKPKTSLKTKSPKVKSVQIKAPIAKDTKSKKIIKNMQAPKSNLVVCNEFDWKPKKDVVIPKGKVLEVTLAVHCSETIKKIDVNPYFHSGPNKGQPVTPNQADIVDKDKDGPKTAVVKASVHDTNIGLKLLAYSAKNNTVANPNQTPEKKQQMPTKVEETKQP